MDLIRSPGASSCIPCCGRHASHLVFDAVVGLFFTHEVIRVQLVALHVVSEVGGILEVECSSFFTTDLRTTFVGFDRISAFVFVFAAVFVVFFAVFFTAFLGALLGFLNRSPPIVGVSGSFVVVFFSLNRVSPLVPHGLCSRLSLVPPSHAPTFIPFQA